uniref:Uncharacterized protein n=1 Tax=Haptolina brevifila TaxID=156173 RepID=A0A7S2DKT7_9EUKA|mmetsp:Transcript_39974/g.80088  ORF Transcript_39974/g.80088 Transcript_39974/m.80088 type:complete len:218 (+) Transcript_39974:122-775(+)
MRAAPTLPHAARPPETPRRPLQPNSPRHPSLFGRKLQDELLRADDSWVPAKPYTAPQAGPLRSSRLEVEWREAPATPTPLLSARRAEEVRLLSPRSDAIRAAAHEHIRRQSEKWANIMNEKRGPASPVRMATKDVGRRLTKRAEKQYWDYAKAQPDFAADNEAFHVLQREKWVKAEVKLRSYLQFGPLALPEPVKGQFIPSAFSAWGLSPVPSPRNG